MRFARAQPSALASRLRALRTWVGIVALTLTLLADPSGVLAQTTDAYGDGTLRPPTAPRYADPALYDLVDVRLLAGDPIRVTVTLGAVDGAQGLPLGITQPIVEVYLDTGPGGAEMLLPGSGLSMPLGDGWQLALRVTGDGAYGWLADDGGAIDPASPFPLDAYLDGRELTLLTPFPRPEEAPRIYAISGVYDPFGPDGWRALTRTESAWAFSSPTQVAPVVDVFPADPATRAAALLRGELPRIGRPRSLIVGSWPWFALMALGLLVAVAGVVLRFATWRPGPTPAGERPRLVVPAAPSAPARRADPTPSPPQLIDDAELPASLVEGRKRTTQTPTEADTAVGKARLTTSGVGDYVETEERVAGPDSGPELLGDDAVPRGPEPEPPPIESPPIESPPIEPPPIEPPPIEPESAAPVPAESEPAAPEGEPTEPEPAGPRSERAEGAASSETSAPSDASRDANRS